MSPDDSRDLIFSFLTQLPQTIRTEAMLFVVLYAVGSDARDSQEFENSLRGFLLEKAGNSAIRSVICAVAAIDFSFDGLVSKLYRAETALKTLTDRDPENLAFQQSHLSLPLRRRHWEQALADWRALRGAKLTPQTFQDFAYNQLMPQRGQ